MDTFRMEEESKIALLPTRMKSSYQDKFKKQRVVSNHYKIQIRGLEKVYLYRVDFEPKIDNEDRIRRNALYSESNQKIKNVIKNPVFAGNIIFTQHKPQLGDEFSIPTMLDSKEIAMKLRLVKTIDFTKTDEATQTMQLHFLDNLLHTYMRKLNFFEIGRSRKFFNPKKREKIQNTDLLLYHGYTANFCRLSSGLYLKIDAASKIVRKETVLDFIDSIYEKNTHLLKEEKRQLVTTTLEGQTVMANYGCSRYWKIEKVLYDKSIDSVFPVENGQEMTLIEYYKKKYNLEITSKKQPLLKCVNRTKIEVLLVPQLCLMTGLPDNFDQRKRREISKYTIRPPAERLQKIKQFRKKLDEELTASLNPKQLSNSLGISIRQDPSQIQSKVIPMPTVKIGGGERIREGTQSNFKLFDRPLYNTDTSMRACVIRFKDFDFYHMEKLFKNTAENLKLKLTIKDARLGEQSARNGIDDIVKEIEYQAEKKQYNIFLVILPTRLKSGYKKLKKICLCDIGVPLQVVVDSISQKKQFQSIATKVLLQMAAKVGNTLWVPTASQGLSKSNIMLVGINSSAQSSSTKRIGVCATTNKNFTSYFSTTSVQDAGSFLIEKLQILLIQCLASYQKVNGVMPDEIVVLRDGCSANQVKYIKQFEVEQCLKAIETSKEHHINLTYVMIDKKPTEKFFGSFDGQVSNPSAGTLINSQLVSDNYDFYLVSQFSNRGTTIPIYYNVIFSDSKIEEGKLAELIYSQCFGYANWSGSIKIPAPAQYAKKISEFTSTNLSQNEVKNVGNLLYYI